ISRYLLAVDGDAAELRVIEWLRAVQFDRDVAIKIIPGPAEKLSDWHTGLQAELIAINRNKNFAAPVPPCPDQPIDIIRAQLNSGGLTSARFLFEILPAFADAPNLLVRSAEFRNGRWRLRDRTRLGHPITAVEQR